MIIENTDLLKLWLTNALRPLCDADPAALAKYVLALIKKDKPDNELRRGMVDQLDVFLQQDTIEFVKKLFHAIDTNDYLNAKEEPDPATIVDMSEAEKMGESILDLTPNTGSDTLNSSASSSLNTSSSSGSGQSPGDSLNLSSSSGSGPNTSSGSGSSGDLNLSSGLLNLSSSSGEGDKSPPSANTSFRFSPERELSPILAPKVEPRNNRSNSSSRKDNRLTSFRDRDRFRRNRSRSPIRRSRSKSRDRGRRSWSPKDHREQRGGGRYRGGMRRSPVRRYEREVWDRRRSPGARNNRSPSPPRGRNRSPERYTRRVYEVNLRARSRSRSPIDRPRSRSPVRHASRIDGMDSQPSSTAAPIVPTVAKPVVEQSGQSDTAAPKRGLCMRGELCPFDHGQNPVVLQDVGLKRTVQVTDVNLPGGLPFSNMAGPPVDFRLMRPQRPMLGMDQMMDGPPPPWAIPPGFHHRGPRGRGIFLRHPAFQLQGPPQRELISIPVMGAGPGLPGGQEMEQEPFPPAHGMGGMYMPRGMHPGRGRGRGRGGFDHSRLGAKPRIYTNCSLEVKRIPKELNNISDLNSHFVQFGKIVNIQINFDNDPEAALITFSGPNEAYMAYKSTDAVLSNRFIRVFWHNGNNPNTNKEKENEEGIADPVPPRPSVRDRLGAQPDLSPPEEKMEVETERILVSGMNVTKTVYNPSAFNHKKELTEEKVQAVEAIIKSQEQLAAQEQLKRLREEKKQENLKLLSDLQKKKQAMLTEQIEQQKKLIHKLESSTTMKPEEKEQLMKLIKTLQESIENIKKGLDEGAQLHPAVRPNPPPNTGITRARRETQRDILDAEMDLYNTELEGGDTIALKRKVLELRAKAKVVGIYPRGRGGYRGGPMMRGYSRGRGSRAIATASRTVDRRTKTLYITGFPAPMLNELANHFGQFGIVAYHKQDPEVPALTISYDHRKSAEIALVKGRNYKELALNIQWVQNTPAPPPPKKVSNNNGSTMVVAEEMDSGEPDESDMYETSVDEFFDPEPEVPEEEEDEDDERTWRR